MLTTQDLYAVLWGGLAPLGSVFKTVRLATTQNHTLVGLAAIDGITPLAGDRVFVKQNTVGSENGIYTASQTSWARADDASTAGQLTNGTQIYVQEGTLNGGKQFALLTTGTLTIGTTALSFGPRVGRTLLTYLATAIGGFVVPPGISNILITLCAGGGGGGNGAAGSVGSGGGGGGGAGGTAQPFSAWFTVSPGQIFNINIGAGGAAAAAGTATSVTDNGTGAVLAMAYGASAGISGTAPNGGAGGNAWPSSVIISGKGGDGGTSTANGQNGTFIGAIGGKNQIPVAGLGGISTANGAGGGGGCSAGNGKYDGASGGNGSNDSATAPSNDGGNGVSADANSGGGGGGGGGSGIGSPTTGNGGSGGSGGSGYLLIEY